MNRPKNFFEVIKIEDDGIESIQFSTAHLEVALGKYNATKGNVELNMWEYRDNGIHEFITTILDKE